MPNRGHWGVTDFSYTHFRGVVEDTDPTELPTELASAALNVDFEQESIRKRLGKSKYNATAFGNHPVTGLHAYYPPDGSDRLLLASDTGDVRLDAGDGFATRIGDGGSTHPLDFVGYQDRVYFGNDIAHLQVWDGSGAAAYVASPIAPSLAFSGLGPTTETVIEDFQDATDWTSSSPGDLDAADLTVGGAVVMELTASSSAALGQYVDALWSAGATVDLSEESEVRFYFNSGFAGLQFQVGVKDNSGTIHWLDILSVGDATAGAWQEGVVNLGPIDPADRDASTGLAILFVTPLHGAGYPQSVLFSSAYLTASFPADTYRYYATWYAGDEVPPRESPPSEVLSLTLAPGHRTASIDLVVPYSGDSSVTTVRIYRHRDDASFAKPRLVVEIPNDSVLTVYNDSRSDSDLLIENALELTTQFQIDPPLAATYAVVRNRLVAGALQDFPWRFSLSEYGKPHAFSSSQDPTDPLAAGFIDLPEKDKILRVLDVDGNVVLLCERSIWTLTGSGWDDFDLQKRASVGLSARWAVAVYGRLILFLAADGVRCLDLAFGASPRVSTWVVSEPVATRLRAISNRSLAAMGLDERDRLHLSYCSAGASVNDSAVVLDLRQPGALTNHVDLLRPGWTCYSRWGFSVFETLKRGGGDDGELLAGDPATGTVWNLQRAAGFDLTADAGATIPWLWQGPCLDVGRGRSASLVYLGIETDPAAGEELTLSAVLDQNGSAQTQMIDLGAQTTGVVVREARIAGRARYVQVKAEGEQAVAMRVRSLGVGGWPRIR